MKSLFIPRKVIPLPILINRREKFVFSYITDNQIFLNSSGTFMKELARTDLVFVQKLRKFVQIFRKRQDVFSGRRAEKSKFLIKRKTAYTGIVKIVSLPEI